MKYFTGVGAQVGQRISILSDVLSTKEEPPRIWYSQSFPTTPRLNEQLQINVLEVQEHLETYFDRKENVMEVIKEAQRFSIPLIIIYFGILLFTWRINSAWRPWKQPQS